MIFIHHRPDWPSFRWDSDVLSTHLSATRYRQGRLIGRMGSLGFPMRTEAVMQALTDDVLKSSEIEGELLDRQQVRSSIARRLGVEIAGLVHSDRQVDGSVEMMLDATQRFEAPLNAERLF